MLARTATWIQEVLPDVDPAIAEGLQALAAVIALLLTWRLFLVARDQTKATLAMVELQKADAAAREIPVVVLDLVEQPGNLRYYVASNVGRGAALNSFVIDNLESEKPNLLALGALLPGQQVVVPSEVAGKLSGEQKEVFIRNRFFVASQPANPADAWTASVNRIDRNGRVSHEVQQWTPPEFVRTAARMLTLDEQLQTYLERVDARNPIDLRPD
jgi:hypothetical protein